MSGPVEGWLYDIGSTRREAARLLDTADGARLETAAGPVVLDAATLTVSSRLGSVPRRIGLPDGRVFETADNDGVDRLFAHHPPHVRTARLAGWERVRLRLAVVAVVCIAIFVAIVRWGLPAAADAAAMIVPYDLEDRVARGTLDALDLAVLEPSSAPADRAQAAQAIFRHLVDQAGLPGERFRLEFRHGGLVGANAFALPGGRIIATDELLALASDAALAGVLAHEIGHVVERHGLKRIFRAAGLAAVVALLTGDVSGILEDSAGIPALLLDLSYSRRFEREADDYAVALMRQAGYDPRALAEFLEQIAGDCGAGCEAPAWLSTHPLSAERAERLRGARPNP